MAETKKTTATKTVAKKTTTAKTTTKKTAAPKVEEVKAPETVSASVKVTAPVKKKRKQVLALKSHLLRVVLADLLNNKELLLLLV